MTSMRVCYVANRAIDVACEGHNIASVGFIQSAIQSGIDTKVVTLEKTNNTPKSGFFPIHTLVERGNRTSYIPSVGELLSSIPAMSFAKSLDCDIIHLLNVTKEIFSTVRKLLRIKAPCVAHLYHSPFPLLSFASFKFRLMLIKSGIFDHILCSNKALAAYLAKEALSADRVHYIPYPVDANRFKPNDKTKLREAYGISPDAQVLSYVGSIDPNRGFGTLLNAFKDVLNDFPDTVLHVSHPARKEDEYRYLPFYKLIHKNFADNVILQGPNPKIEDVYSLADAVVIPFEQPYWVIDPPVVFVEAMASGTPIVTTPVGSIGEIGKDRESMFFANPGDSRSLSNAIKNLLSNQDEAKEVGLNARKTVKEKFSQEVVGELLKKTYREILE